jgi:hypothetical protein
MCSAFPNYVSQHSSSLGLLKIIRSEYKRRVRRRREIQQGRKDFLHHFSTIKSQKEVTKP